MPETSTRLQYPLSSSGAEFDRLIRQAARLAPYTERFFQQAGIGSGQRVLDLGSGAGDVAFLAARLVGSTGEVIGMERNPEAVVFAQTRAAKAGLGNLIFTTSDVSQLSDDTRSRIRCLGE